MYETQVFRREPRRHPRQQQPWTSTAPFTHQDKKNIRNERKDQSRTQTGIGHQGATGYSSKKKNLERKIPQKPIMTLSGNQSTTLQQQCGTNRYQSKEQHGEEGEDQRRRTGTGDMKHEHTHNQEQGTGRGSAGRKSSPSSQYISPLAATIFSAAPASP